MVSSEVTSGTNTKDTNRQTKFTVGICGGGIAGLILANSIQRFSSGDIRVNIYESTKEFTEIGAGVGLWKRPWKVLKSLGLAENMRKLTTIPEDEDIPQTVFEMRRADRPQGVPFYKLITPMGALAYHRAEFLDVIASKLDPSITTPHFSKRLVTYSQETPVGPITLNFKDGTTATCDVLIGADGIHSATRHCLLKAEAEAIEKNDPERAKVLLDMMEPMWSGTTTYRALITTEKLREVNPEHSSLKAAQLYMGKFGHVMALHITLGLVELINVGFSVAWPEKEGTVASDDIRDCDKEEIRSQFVGWEDEVQQLIECLDTVTKWPTNALKGLPISVRGRVALAGDAAHAMVPFQGSGAGEAIEDAYILANLLAHPKTTLSTLPDVLKVYESIRLTHANDVQRRSRLNGRLYDFVEEPQAMGFCLGKGILESSDLKLSPGELEMEKLKQVGDALVENWDWAWLTDVDDDLERAMKLLEERLG